jgi:hypothetical protein
MAANLAVDDRHNGATAPSPKAIDLPAGERTELAGELLAGKAPDVSTVPLSTVATPHCPSGFGRCR